jgi:hypothetical protein
MVKAAQQVSMIRTELLTEPERNAATHVRRLTEGLVTTARASVKELAGLFAPPKALPRG